MDEPALLHFSVQVTGGRDAVQQLLVQLEQFGKIERVSSVYKTRNNRKEDDLHGLMEGVIKIIFKNEVNPIALTSMSTIESKVSRVVGAPIKLKLLAQNQQVSMTPSLALPAPALYSVAFITRCAAEVWPSYQHPILKKTLAELAKEAPPSPEEFLWQGKSFVAF